MKFPDDWRICDECIKNWNPNIPENIQLEIDPDGVCIYCMTPYQYTNRVYTVVKVE